MSSLIYNPYTVEYDGCEDCCSQYVIVNSCPTLFPNGISRYWEFTIPAQPSVTCGCGSFSGVWNLDALSGLGISNLSQGCGISGSCNYIARPRTSSDVIRTSCFLSGSFYTFDGWRFCAGKQSQTSANFVPNIPTNSMTLGGYITSSPFYFGVAWFIELSNFNPLGPNVLQRSIWTPSNTLFLCTALPATITIEPVL